MTAPKTGPNGPKTAQGLSTWLATDRPTRHGVNYSLEEIDGILQASLAGSVGKDGAPGPQGPQGIQGIQGNPGQQGPPGSPGIGTPSGGVTGQVLAKQSNADYDTGWVTQSSGAGLSFVYQCTGKADSTAIANIINDFFTNGTAITMKLIITGTMGLEATNSPAIYIPPTTPNNRGAVCYLDFSDCNIMPSSNSFPTFISLGGAINVFVTGLKLHSFYTCLTINNATGSITFNNCYMMADNGNTIALSNSQDVAFNNCYIVGNDMSGLGTPGAVYLDGNCAKTSITGCIITSAGSVSVSGLVLQSTFSGVVMLLNSKIMIDNMAVFVFATSQQASIKMIGCSITNNISQASAESTVSWHITGCSFAVSNFYGINGQKTVGMTGNPQSQYLYMPDYANLFDQIIS